MLSSLHQDTTKNVIRKARPKFLTWKRKGYHLSKVTLQIFGSHDVSVDSKVRELEIIAAHGISWMCCDEQPRPGLAKHWGAGRLRD